MKLAEAVDRVIGLANRIDDYYTVEEPKYHPNYPLVNDDEGEPPPPPEEKELSDCLASLPDEMIYQLLLIMDLGRTYFGTDELADYYERLKSGFEDKEEAASFLMKKTPTLAFYLSEGLEELRKHKINLDRLPLKKPSVRRR